MAIQYATRRNYAPKKKIARKRRCHCAWRTGGGGIENLRFARDILRENGFSDTVLLATQSYHQWRACRMAKLLGLTPYPLHAKTNLKSLPKNLCREFLAILKFLLFTRKE